MFPFRKTFHTLGALLGASQLGTFQSSIYFAFLVCYQSGRSTDPAVAGPQYGAFLFFKGLLYVAIGVYSQSCLNCAYLKFHGHPSPLGHLTVDPFFALVTTKYSATNVYFLTGLGLLGVSFVYVDYGLSLGLDPSLTRLICQLICENPRALFTINPHLQKVPSPREALLHPVKGFTAIRRLSAQLWNPSRKLTFARLHLEGFPFLSKRTRSRLLLLTLLYENALSGAALALVVPFGLVVILVMILLCSDVSLLFAVAVLLDILLLALICWHTLLFIFFAIHVLLLFTFLTRTHLKEVNHKLENLLLQVGKHRPSNGSHLLSRQLSVFFAQHRSLASLQVRFNEQMVSPFFCIAFFTALLFQVVQLNILLLEELQLEEKCFCLGVSMLETVFALQCIRLLISWTDSLYSSRCLLFQAQKLLLRSAIPPTPVASQLKLMTYIERLCTEKKASFTVGPLGAISYRALYEFFFVYSGFFLYIASLMR